MIYPSLPMDSKEEVDLCDGFFIQHIFESLMIGRLCSRHGEYTVNKTDNIYIPGI